MIVIGIDPHKCSHTATAVDPATNVDLGSLRIRSTISDYETLLQWSRRWPEHRWAVENGKGLGHHLSLWLLEQGESVVDVPSTATAARTIALTPPPQPVLQPCKAKAGRSMPRTTPACCGSSTNAAATSCTPRTG